MNSGLKIVAIGGGHGLPIALRSVKRYADQMVAVATVADDGGSSGRLRDELGVLPPGDSRNCLVAMADGDLMSRLFQYRFPGADGIGGHAIGNLLIAALTDLTGDFGAALDHAAKILQAKGRVIPPTKEKIDICAHLEPEGTVCGQCNVANRLRPLNKIWLEPSHPVANEEAVEAIRDADQIVIGPGSLFTSIIPNLLIPGIRDAVAAAKGQRVFICNTVIQPGETDGFTVADHISAFNRYAGERLIDMVVINRSTFSAESLDDLAERRSYPIIFDPEEADAVGIEYLIADVANFNNPARHDVEKLGTVLAALADKIRVKSR